MQGLSLERKNLLSCRSERVKAVDFHPTEPWVLSALYNGTVTVRNYHTNSLVKTIEVCDLPVRTARFVARKNWIVTGSDDLVIRVFNYNTLERVAQFAAHSDYIRGLAIHPTRPFLLSCSDDLTVRLWDWDRAWRQTAVFEGHTHFVMSIALNPKDSSIFATVSLDRTIKMWSLSMLASAGGVSNATAPPVSIKANYTMGGEGGAGHDKGINCIDFYGGTDRPFLATGADDCTVRIWDYHTKSCVRVLEGHGNNVSGVAFHPQLPLLLTAGEDGAMRIWSSQTFRAEASYNFGMERAWSVACSRGLNAIALGFDAGTVVFQLGRGDPCSSLDLANGRLVWARVGAGGAHGNEILGGTVRLLDAEGRTMRTPGDGEPVALVPKELGTSDVFPQSLQHSPDGRLVAVWGDGEYVIYSAIGWRNRAFGRGQELAWASSATPEVFAVRETTERVAIHRAVTGDRPLLLAPSGAERIFGGRLLGISVGGGTALSFYDWGRGTLIRTIDVAAVGVSWAPDGSRVAILTEEGCFVLAVNDAVLEAPDAFVASDDGIEEALRVEDELEECLRAVCWVNGECFVYLTRENRLAYHVVGGGADESFQLALFDRPVFLLGHLSSEGRVYLTDQDLQVTSYAVQPALVAFQSAVLSGGDLAGAMALLDALPAAYYARLAVFLHRRGHSREALKLSPDAHFQFELALGLGDLSLARDILMGKLAAETGKWRDLGRAALSAMNLPVAEEALQHANDLSSLLLLYAAAGDRSGLLRVAGEAVRGNATNLAFTAYVQAGHLLGAFDLLLQEGRAAEAAFFARSHGLSAAKIAEAVAAWKRRLIAKRRDRMADALADPDAHPERFPALQRKDGDDMQFNLGEVGRATVADVFGVFAPPPIDAGDAVPAGAGGHGRTRSVSFDSSVSVAGSASTVSLKAAGDVSGGDEAAGGEWPVTQMADEPTGGNVSAATSGSHASSATGTDPASYLSDDQLSMEVNTAGTGTRLEDLEEEEEEGGNVSLTGGCVEDDLDQLVDITEELALEENLSKAKSAVQVKKLQDQEPRNEESRDEEPQEMHCEQSELHLEQDDSHSQDFESTVPVTKQLIDGEFSTHAVDTQDCSHNETHHAVFASHSTNLDSEVAPSHDFDAATWQHEDESHDNAPPFEDIFSPDDAQYAVNGEYDYEEDRECGQETGVNAVDEFDAVRDHIPRVSTISKAKGSDDESAPVHEEIDFGGDGDAHGWL